MMSEQWYEWIHEDNVLSPISSKWLCVDGGTVTGYSPDGSANDQPWTLLQVSAYCWRPLPAEPAAVRQAKEASDWPRVYVNFKSPELLFLRWCEKSSTHPMKWLPDLQGWDHAGWRTEQEYDHSCAFSRITISEAREIAQRDGGWMPGEERTHSEIVEEPVTVPPCYECGRLQARMQRQIKHIESLEAKLGERKAKIREMEETPAPCSGCTDEIEWLEMKLAERDALIAELEQMVAIETKRSGEQAEWPGKEPLIEEVLVDEIARLRAIVAKLPKTADGVPVVPGSIVYRWSDMHEQLLECEVSTFQRWDDAYMPAVTRGNFQTNALWCYSTREAAEKARTR
jgi:hypothetical protein